MEAWRPPRRLTLSQWADANFYLSAENAAEPGRWHTIPYQRGIMDAITDPAVSQVSLMKSARVGYTLMMSAAIGYHIEHDPAPILVVQPTVEDGKNYSKETIAPMLRDVPVLAAIHYRDLEDKGPKDSSNTLTHKAFPGGVLSIIGANSGTGFRRISRRVVMFDEVDAYPPSAGSEGDPIRLGIMRTQTFWNRKIIAGSTPLTAGLSRIAELFESGDQRRYHVPCPTCGHMDYLTFREADEGHFMRWPEGKPEEAHFICRSKGCVIEHRNKRWMVERGGWRAAAPFKGHASFHIWAAYSYSPNASWGQIAQEFVAATQGGVEKLRTFVNTLLGEGWVERGDAPEWQRLYQRREPYPRGQVPARAVLLTAGVDVQKDRLIWEVVAWGPDRESWSVDCGVVPGDPAKEAPWLTLEADVLNASWTDTAGAQRRLTFLAVDSGYETQSVYNWARRHVGRVLACKGVPGARTALVGSPTPVDVTVAGRRQARGCKVWPVGVESAKSELYGWLRLDPPTAPGEAHPPGFCHFPEYGEDFFKELTAEHLVRSVSRQGFMRYEWQVIPGRPNHQLDCRVYARAAASVAGLDRAAARRPRKEAPPPPAAAEPRESAPGEAAPQPFQAEPPRPSWLGGGRGAIGRSGWLRRRR